MEFQSTLIRYIMQTLMTGVCLSYATIMVNDMQAAIIKEKQVLVIEDVDKPEIKDNEVLVHVKASGVCGTDLHVYEGEVPIATLPVIPGHEFCGVVEAVGDAIKDVNAGDRIAIEPNLFCGYCHFCRNAKKHFCENWQAVGLTRSGGFAEYCAVPRQAVYKMEDSLSFNDGAFFEPTACVLHGIERSHAKAGDTVVVMGAGSIGLIYVQALKLMGIKSVISCDIDDNKLELAKVLGADAALNTQNEDVPAVVKDMTLGLGAEVVVDAAGAPQTLSMAFNIVQNCGTIVVFGVPPEHLELPIKMYDIYRREISVVGSFTNPYTNEQALKMMATGKIKYDKILTHPIALDQVEDAILKMRDRTETVIKAQIQF
ncbi:MAG TPA: zinc-dependent alcohol dehydrogenase family protein [Candidatus Lokiarchaeia archaeon]|nr:zinc-dependent alcohol dehydrogenase family protein [Candidatus Lokiarchaeia archaeon]